ncbi:maleylpyruvate isomerase family mycothiol-dependent enzyme [Nocardia puris]|nr:maleylpyruvate isomerase family mycothiol-dependent enzyme [Nocardia puris]MBF6213613.1 maleylpyruvate isomerase family mycothiol-dependent enzyme [Nocardia puris]MBF6365457.1 maleylpyruvate isomerase family mycothiol-dependent enzyme [Nocardia puris]MBF6459923.1 maleylpyruvate isomerase family mycothiol-dependent enzyme [Nocardia puris]
MAARFAELTADASDLDREVTATPGWSVSDVLGHVAMEPSRYNQLALGGGTWPRRVTDLPAFNAEQIRTLPTRDPAALAAKLRADTDELGRTVRGFGGAVPLMNFDGDQRIRPDRALGTLLGEFTVHGYDIARTLRRPWPIDPAFVPLIMDGLHQVLPGWLDPARAAGHTATYAIRLRGLGTEYVYRFDDGRLVVDPPGPTRPDVRFNAEPITWLLLAYGRLSPLVPALTGRVLATGRKPWLAPRFARLFHAA